MLPEDIKNIVKGKKGAPNIWQIPEPIHKIIHKGAKGGYYNAAWLDAINELKDKSLGKIHPDDIFQIRETLVEIFGLAVWRP